MNCSPIFVLTRPAKEAQTAPASHCAHDQLGKGSVLATGAAWGGRHSDSSSREHGHKDAPLQPCMLLEDLA